MINESDSLLHSFVCLSCFNLMILVPNTRMRHDTSCTSGKQLERREGASALRPWWIKHFETLISGPLQRPQLQVHGSESKPKRVPVWDGCWSVRGGLHWLWLNVRWSSICGRNVGNYSGARSAGGLGCCSKDPLSLGRKHRSDCDVSFEHQHAGLRDSHFLRGHGLCQLRNSGSLIPETSSLLLLVMFGNDCLAFVIRTFTWNVVITIIWWALLPSKP